MPDAKPPPVSNPGNADSTLAANLLQQLLVDDDASASPSPPVWRRQAAGDHVVELSRVPEGERLEIRGRDGDVRVRVMIGETGVVLALDARELSIHAAERLCIASAHIEIVAEESLALRSGGAIRQSAATCLESRAFEHEFESTRGEIRLIANDDVSLDGERIRLNSPKLATAR